MTGSSQSRLTTYADLVVGTRGWLAFAKYELIVGLLGVVPGVVGLALRKTFYPFVLGSVGRNVVFGRNVTIRHGAKIRIGNDVIIDDHCVIDAKGGDESRVVIGDRVFVGRHSILYTKDGAIDVGDDVNIGVHCVVYSNNRVLIGDGTLMAAYCHVMSGGEYDYESDVPLHRQSSGSRGATCIGSGSWLGSKSIIQDNVSLGTGVVVGAGAVVTKDVPDDAVAIGVPATTRPKRAMSVRPIDSSVV